MDKKIVLLSLFACLFLVGCTPIQDMTLEEVIKIGTERTVKVYNKYRKGYKYNLPKGLETYDNSEYNEIIMGNDYTYYLYVDAVSYYNKVIEKYEENDKSYISMQINYQDKYGYLEINELSSGKYFIEIMYNYAKIEVMVDYEDINLALYNCVTILKDLEYNDMIIEPLVNNKSLNFKEETYDIFNPKSKDSSYLNIIDGGTQDSNIENTKDFDLVN